jgi:hypothetical protein
MTPKVEVQEQVSAPAKPVMVLQSTLGRYIHIEKRIEVLKRDLKATETTIKDLLNCGAPIQSGNHTAKLVPRERITPKWKDEGEKLAEELYGKGQGATWIKKVQDNTEPSFRVELVVE